MILLAADDAKRRSGTSTQKRARLIRRQWLVAASAGTIAAATPGFYGGRASAQALPAECTDSGGGGTAENGETITCVAASPLVIDGVSTTASDLTIVIGDASTPTTVTGTGEGVKMSGDGAQTLNIVNPGSVVGGAEGVDITVSTQSSTGDLTIVSEGEIRGSATGNGITARNFGSGATTITVNDVTGKNAIYATVRDSGGDLTVSSDGVVKSLGGRAIYASVGDAGGVGDLTIDTSGGVATGGYVSGTIYAIQNGVGDIYIKTGNVTAGGAGVRATNVPGGGLVTVDTSAGTVSGGSVGVSATQISNTYLNIKVDDVSGGVGVLARGRGPTVIELTSTADVEGTTGAGVDAQTTGGNILLTGPSGANTGLSGAIDGATDGVYMRSGTSLQPNVTGGSITIRDLAAITGAGGHGLDIDSYGGAVAISDIANITGFGDATTPGDQGHGIKVVSQDGDVSIQRVGLGQNNLVEGKEGAGIYVHSGAGNIDIGGEVDSATGAVTGVGNITGSANGIDTLATTGVTEITLDATATIVGLAGAGISAQSAPGSQNQGGDILVRGLSGGAVTGATHGIQVEQNSMFTYSKFMVRDLASVTGQGADGINIDSDDITISSVDNISGAANGVNVRSRTNLSIQNVGVGIGNLIEGVSGHGINAHARGGGVNIGGDANGAIGNVKGGVHGIYAYSYNSGASEIGVTIDSSGGDVEGGSDGIRVFNFEASGGASITTGKVTGGTGDGIFVKGISDSSTLTIDTSAGAVAGGDNGIDASSLILGAATLTVGDVFGNGAEGVRVITERAGASITLQGASADPVNRTGAITGATDGALLQTAGADITVKTLASITGNGGDGLNLNSGGGAVTISGVTNITGFGDGDASNVTFDGNGVRAISGNGDISIQGVDLIEGRDGHGIFAVSGTGGINIGGATAIGDVKGELMGVNVNVGAGGAGGLTINTTGGAVEAVRFSGINARNYSAGATTITTANVEGGAALYGIYAYNAASAGNMIVTTSAGAVSGAAGGIRVNQKGTGSASLTVGEVSGGVGVDVDTTSGAAEITLTSTADVEGTTGAGVDAWSKTGNVLLKGSLTPQGQLSGQITGATHGVDLRSGGFNPRFVGGDITVKDLDAVTGQGGNGIDVWSSDGAVTVSNIANVTGVQGAGVDVDINGDVSIQGLGVGDGNLVEGKWGHGIYAYSTYGGINIGGVTPIGNVKGSSNGISANLDSSEGGAMTIDTSAGSVTGGLEGIGAHHNSDELLSITVGDVVGGRIGIDASANGGGAMEITLTSTANVVGETGAGVRARASPNWNSLTGASGSILLEGETGGADRVITGATDGVFLRSQGNVGGGGNITVKDLDAVTGQGGGGIYAWSNGGDITIADIANVTGVGDPNTVGYEGDGIVVVATSGDVSIQGLGLGDGNLVEGREGAGISVYSNTGDVNIGGATAIGNVKASHNGIDAEIGTGGLALTINTSGGAVEGGNTGIRAFNFGDGAVSITTADVTGRGEFGVEAYNFVDGAGVVIDTSAGLVTSGEDDAIRARNYGAGPLSITAGAVDARAGGEFADAIDARSESDADVTIVSTGPLSAADDGIDVRQEGNGALSITATGTVSGGDTGILAYNTNDGDGALTIMTTGAVSGGVHGIIARNESYGAVVITAADVTAETGIGVFGRNSRYGGDLTIDTSAGSVTGGFFGIYARNYSYGALSITANNIAALGGGGRAIRAVNSVNGASMTIATSGTVVSADGDGVGVMNRGGALTIMATGAISGAGHGITAINYGGGGVSITAADVTGTNAAGVYVQNIGGDYLTIDTSAGAVKGGREGIRAGNFGVGAFAITAADVTGAADDGVSVYNSARSSDLTINANEGALTGFLKGIDAENQGSGATVITIAGAVAGETEEGVRAATANGATIIVEDGGSAAGATAAIVMDSAAAPGEAVDDALTINAGGSVDGDALLLAGDDTFNDAGGSFTTVFGGDGLDTVNFTGGARTLTGSGAAGDSIQEFEVFNIGSDGLVLAGAHVGLSEANFLAGANTLAGSLEAAAAVIAPGATLNAADGAVLTGVLTNNGTLNVGDSPGTFRVNGDLVLGATSFLPMEVGATSDHIVVSGEVILGGALDIITLQGTPAGVVTRTIIDGRTGVSGAFDTITSENGLLINQTVSVNPVGSDVLLTTSVSTASSLGGLNNNQTTVGDSLIGLLNDPSLDPALLGLIGAVGAIEDIDALGSTLGELTPEGFDIGLKFMTTSQSRFIDAALGQTLRSGAEPEAVRLASLSGGPVAASADGVATAWGALETYRFSQGGGFDHVGFDGVVFSFAAGVSGVAAGPVSFGIASGYSNFNGDADGALGDAADANLFHIAGTAGVRFNIRDFDTRVDTVVGYATGDSEVAMMLVDPVADEVILQRGDAGVSSFDWMTRLTLDGTEGDEWAVKPYFQTGVTVYHQDAVDVGPATNATALRVDELDNSRWQIGFGATYERRIDDRLSVNARAAALQYFNDTENAFASRFAAAPEGTPAFRTAGREVDRQFQFDAALAYEHKSGVVFSVGAFGEAGDLNLYGGNLRLRKRF